MRLLPRLARQARTTEETAVPDTTTDIQTSTDVIMRFLTQGGAAVDLRSHTWTELAVIREERVRVERTGFRWSCAGCDTTGPREYDSRTGYYESEPRESRDHANAHADACRAMPRS